MATTLERTHKPLSIQKKTLPPEVYFGHVAGLVIFGGLILLFTWLNFQPIVQAPALPEETVQLPEYDYTIWRGLVDQHKARLKPFETAAQEVCREIHGRNKVLGHDSVAVVLSWTLEGNPNALKRQGRWDDKAFILCENHDARRFIFLIEKDGTLKQDNLTPQQVHGKFMSPNQLKAFIATYVHLKQTKLGKLKEMVPPPLEDELRSVEGRLNLYEALRNPQDAESDYQKKHMGTRDPFGFVTLDKVPGSPWFSIGQLRQIQQDKENWFVQMKERVKDVPELYLSQKHKAALEEFQKKLQAGQSQAATQELKQLMADNRNKQVARYVDLQDKKKHKEAAELLKTAVVTWMSARGEGKQGKEAEEAAKTVLDAAQEKKDTDVEQTSKALGEVLVSRDNLQFKDLEKLLQNTADYQPAKPENRLLYMTYLELRFPDLYTEIMQWQDPPLASIRKVLDSFDALSAAYDSGDAGKFARASQEYFTVLKEVSESETNSVYPGEDTIMVRLGHLVSGDNIGAPSPQMIDLELTFNRVKPFMWAWVLMLGSLLLFCLSLGLNSRPFYIAGFSLYAVSLGFQLFGFFTRIVVSGRPPVSNMYETVIWVSFMTGIFALILESIYRRKVIAVAGAFVATLGLVLADQLPLALDPRITSLLPVLRSNFWLTIHVLTIVSSYAGGALAWALGNIALVLIVFGHANRDTVKMLSNFTYRAMQIAVLLLASGTFLGGWWAAYSWGRFWGWDPKETGALIALVCYVIPLHMRFVGWIKDFGMAVAAIVCFAAVMISWYGVNFIFPAGLHAYGFGAGGAGWVYWAACINLEWVFAASLIYRYKQLQPLTAVQPA